LRYDAGVAAIGEEPKEAGPTRLDYAPGRGWARRNRWKVLLAVVLASTLIGAWQRGQAALFVDRVRALRAERACRVYERPADWVVYDEEQRAVDELAGKDRGYVKFRQGQVVSGGSEYAVDCVGWVPDCYRDFRWAGMPKMQYVPVAFLHERRTPAGKARLVLVTVMSLPAAVPGFTFSPGEPEERLVATVYEEGSMFSYAKSTAGSMSVTRTLHSSLKKGALRLLAGHADANDAAHFTVPYKLGRREGVIEGWLRDDDTVTLRTRGLN
jgi:hypothetical protein